MRKHAWCPKTWQTESSKIQTSNSQKTSKSKLQSPNFKVQTAAAKIQGVTIGRQAGSGGLETALTGRQDACPACGPKAAATAGFATALQNVFSGV
jgi:hypothetical protein